MTSRRVADRTDPEYVSGREWRCRCRYDSPTHAHETTYIRAGQPKPRGSGSPPPPLRRFATLRLRFLQFADAHKRLSARHGRTVWGNPASALKVDDERRAESAFTRSSLIKSAVESPAAMTIPAARARKASVLRERAGFLANLRWKLHAWSPTSAAPHRYGNQPDAERRGTVLSARWILIAQFLGHIDAAGCIRDPARRAGRLSFRPTTRQPNCSRVRQVPIYTTLGARRRNQLSTAAVSAGPPSTAPTIPLKSPTAPSTTTRSQLTSSRIGRVAMTFGPEAVRGRQGDNRLPVTIAPERLCARFTGGTSGGTIFEFSGC